MNRSDRILSLALGAALLGSPCAVQADVNSLFTEDFSAWSGSLSDFGNGTDFGVELVAPPTPFNSGNAVRLFDLSSADKPELVTEFASPLLVPFRLDFQSFNRSLVAGSANAIRFRMSNAGDSVGTESNVPFSISWQADGRLSYKYSDLGADGNMNDVDTSYSTALDGAKSITLVVNGALAGNYNYMLFGENRSLNPLAYDLFIDGVLLNTSWANGAAFHTGFSTGYDSSLGLSRLGLIGNGNAQMDPDYLFDNIILRTGPDIVPEPSSLALLGLGGLFLALRRSR